jgi:hypothetical protein
MRIGALAATSARAGVLLARAVRPVTNHDLIGWLLGYRSLGRKSPTICG